MRYQNWTRSTTYQAYATASNKCAAAFASPTGADVITTVDEYGTTKYTITTDGKAGVLARSYTRRDQAETHVAIATAAPGALVTYEPAPFDRSRSFVRTATWVVEDAHNDDPRELKERYDVALGVTEIAVRAGAAVATYREGRADRIQARAEKAAKAEAIVAAAERAEIAELENKIGPLATERQIDYILILQARRARSGEGGGFINHNPATRDELRRTSRETASNIIDSLTGNY